MEVLRRANWVDLLALILILRIGYTGSFLGIGKQILPLLSLLFTLTFSLYYYDKITLFITSRSTLPRSVCEFFIFLFIVIILSIITQIINRYIRFKRPEVLVPIERVGGVVFGLLRATIITGLIFVILLLTPIEGIGESIRSSASGTFIVKLNLDFYTNIINAIRKDRTDKEGAPYEKVTTLGMLGQLIKEKDYKFRLFGFDLKEKSRFFREETH